MHWQLSSAGLQRRDGLSTTSRRWAISRYNANWKLRMFLLMSQWNITVTSKWARRRLKSPALRVFTQPFIQAQIKENIKAPRYWPLCGEFTGDRWIPRTMTSNAENVSIWWRHHDSMIPCDLCGLDDVIPNGRRDLEKSRGTSRVKLCCYNYVFLDCLVPCSHLFWAQQNQ